MPEHSQPNNTMPVWLNWLRQRLLPSGSDTLMVAAYIIILGALINFILGSSIPPGPRYYATIVFLAALFVLNILLTDIERVFPGAPGHTLFFGLSFVLFTLINYLGLSDGWSLLPFLLFMIASQAAVTFPWPISIGYSIMLVLSWFGVLYLHTGSLDPIVINAAPIGLGLVFSLTFSMVLQRVAAETDRANRLLADLQTANVELERAREREKALAVAEERVRLARDIHDGLGHYLTVLNVQIQAASRLLPIDQERASQSLDLCREQAQAALAEVRRSVATMRHSPLDGRSLPEAIEALVHDFGRASALDVSLTMTGEPFDLAPVAAMTLYRAVQEGLTNAQKHAQGSTVTVWLDHLPDTIRLTVRDNGIGAAVLKQPAVTDSGFGLAGLRERAEQLGGSLSVGPAADGGFLLEITLPV
jgi:signal transduction histidine kinase